MLEPICLTAAVNRLLMLGLLSLTAPVKVMAVRVPPIMRSEAALRQFGPEAFGMSEPYCALE